LKGKCILLGVTGGIAAYKAVEILRGLVKEGADVWTIMTRAAQEFITPLTFQVLSGHHVRTELFSPIRGGEVEHIALAERAHVAVVAPATANILAKMAHGIADDLLSTTLLALRCPVVVCPAMNVNMYRHPTVQENLTLLRRRGVHVVEPEEGELACGWEGKGRLAAPEIVVERLREVLAPKDLTEEHVLVTAGPTREPLDPVRFLSNPSSGKMGFALARAARLRGARVTLVSGPTGLRPPEGVRFVSVTTAEEMFKAVLETFPEATVVVKAAAVADFRPKTRIPQKIKKGDSERFVLELERTPDILLELGRKKGERILVGFAAETRDVVKSAREKLQRKNLDLIVANDLTREGAGFGVDTNEVILVHRNGAEEALPRLTKAEVAWIILDRIASLRKQEGAS